MAGYVRTHRDALEHPVFQDDWLWRLFSWCLLKANWRPMRFRGSTIQPGQFVTGRIRASEELGVSPSKWYRGIQKLESPEYGCIKVEANSEWTIVTVVNWQTYQSDDDTARTASEQPADSQRTTNEQPADTIKELQELKDIYPSTDVDAGGEPQGKHGKRKPFTYPAEFEAFWSAYPRRVAKMAALKAFNAAVKVVCGQHGCERAEAADFLVECAREYAEASRSKDQQFIPHPATWLNSGRYDDPSTEGSAA